MTRVTSLVLRRSTGYVDKAGDLPAMSEPLVRLHTDTGLVTAYADWTTEAEPAEQHSGWLVAPDGARERRSIGGPGGHMVYIRLEPAIPGRYTFEIVEGTDGTGPILAATTLDIDVGFE